MCAELARQSWHLPPLFKWLQEHGQISDHEMYRVFNCGVGMVIVVAAENADAALTLLNAHGEQAWKLGHIRPRQSNEAQTIII
jgi:phosphoribosylformylglycinamidine cyclo-ligase